VSPQDSLRWSSADLTFGDLPFGLSQVAPILPREQPDIASLDAIARSGLALARGIVSPSRSIEGGYPLGSRSGAAGLRPGISPLSVTSDKTWLGVK
jgi:hypothetical protein